MKQAVVTTLLWLCALGCGLLGGLYFAFSAFIMRALAQVGQAGIVAMNSINTVILRSLFMPFFVGTTIASLALVALGALELPTTRGWLIMAGGIIYVAGMFVVTMVCNVPLNNALLAVAQESTTGAAIWKHYLASWTRWNHVRTLSCVVASALFILALTIGTVPLWRYS